MTNGGSEANFVTMWHLVEPGDEVVSMVPNYGQTLGLAEAFGGVLKPWPLRLSADGRRWHVDLDDLRSARHRQDAPHHPLQPEQPDRRAHPGVRPRRASAQIAGSVGAWVLSDEIYRGAELDGVETPSVWGRYERVIITSGLSKAYGLPGLRIGWIASAPQVVATTWGYHDYTTIGPGTLSDRLARIALQPAMRAKILARTRRILQTNLPVITGWLDAHAERFSYALPDAGAIVYMRYHDAINSTALVDRLRVEKSVLIVPGDHFGMDGYLRIGFGSETRYLRDGLDRLRPPAPRACRPGLARSVAPWSTWTCSSSASATSASASRGCSTRSPSRLRGDYDLSWRVVGIATKRHGTAYDARGLDVVKALRLAEAGTPLGALIGAESGRTLSPERLGPRPDQARDGRGQGSAGCSTSWWSRRRCSTSSAASRPPTT